MKAFDAAMALYEWNYQKQLLHIKIAEGSGTTTAHEEAAIFSEPFLLKRPLLLAITQDTAPVLLIDEVDRCVTAAARRMLAGDLSAPLTEHTVGMIGAGELAALGSDGVLINVGRGPLVVEHALYEALSGRTIAGAAIDVWYQYPAGDGHAAPSLLPFEKLPNVLMTPHSSGVIPETGLPRR